MSKRNRTNYLSVAQAFKLECACRELTYAFGPRNYQVGSSLDRPDWRDVDIRCLLSDEEYSNLSQFGMKFISIGISEWLSKTTGLPIDFQFQQQTQANKEYPKQPRSFVGSVPSLRPF